ncbi:hypothetical protein [Amycolatopsis thailandensis]|uniref:hypothetical protein n=1 Tax=Amycolatopsis thailandensis TaxID=589330 RepID=UPI0036305D9E
MSTSFDADAIEAAAGKIGKIMKDHMGTFEALKPHWPNAGKFQLAVWLERVVDDRRNGIVAHAEHLRIAFETFEKKLKELAKEFEEADGKNADKINKSILDFERAVVSDVNKFDDNTEKEQHNFTEDKEKKGFSPNSPADGDGYNDNLKEKVTT